MKQFLLLYWLSIGLFFAIFYWDISPIASILNHGQTEMTSFLTSLTLPSTMMEEHRILINPYYELVIEKACNGMIPYLFFLAFIVAFPATWRHKLIWAVIGYVVIEGINVLRIWIVSQMVLESRSNFSLAHDYLGNILLIATALSLFVLFVKTKRECVVSSHV
jgi:exosortase/archaeosortase family protein